MNDANRFQVRSKGDDDNTTMMMMIKIVVMIAVLTLFLFAYDNNETVVFVDVSQPLGRSSPPV